MGRSRKRSPDDLRAEIAGIGASGRNRDRVQLEHELQVHQEEVAVQHEQLVATRAELEESQKRFADLFDFAPIGYLTINPHGLVREINFTAAAMIGKPRASIAGLPLTTFIEDADRGPFLEFMRTCRAHADPKTTRAIELRLKGPSGPVEVEVVAIPRSVPGSDEPEFLTAVIDTTHRRQAEREHAEAIRAQAGIEARDMFLATLSHELRTPLNPVMAALTDPHLLADAPAPMDDVLAMMRRNLRLEVRLIDDLLDLARISTGRLTITREPLDVHLTIRDVVSIFRQPAADRSIQLDLRLGAECPWVAGDPTRLVQVLSNLLNNALKFTPRGGTVTIATVNTREREIAVTVRDTGQGIDPARLEEIFSGPERGRTKPVASTSGLGIGLAISRQLIAAHGGTLEGRSQGHGLGSAFTITLATTAPPRPAVRPVPTAHVASGDQRRILVVEDDADSAMMLSMLLTLHGYRVTVASSVADAFRQASPPPDMLVSDLKLPDGTGLDLITALRRAGVNVPAIVLSGFARVEDLERSKAAGFAAHLVKPVDMPTLLATIERILRASAPPGYLMLASQKSKVRSK